jgi:hypothetical protein
MDYLDKEIEELRAKATASQNQLEREDLGIKMNELYRKKAAANPKKK